MVREQLLEEEGLKIEYASAGDHEAECIPPWDRAGQYNHIRVYKRKGRYLLQPRPEGENPEWGLIIDPR